MEYVDLNSFPYYSQCAEFVGNLGYFLVELHIAKIRGGTTKIDCVVASKNPAESIGVNDCAKVHRALMEYIEGLLGTEDTEMELSSPGMERNIKNAAEFVFFIGRDIRVWDKNITDWVSGKLVSADSEKLTLEIKKESGVEQQALSYIDIAKAKFIHL